MNEMFKAWNPWGREALWLAAATWAVSTILIANPALDHPFGSNWPHYFESAQFFWDPTSAYFDWRTPMYPYVLATLGQHLGFVQAAQLIAQTSTIAMVFATGMLARALAGPIAAVIAVLSVPAFQCAVESATWSNMYPMAAGVMAMAIALGAITSRWPTRLGFGITALLAATAWQINHLGLVTIPIALGMATLGVVVQVPRRQWALWLVIGLLGLSGPVVWTQWSVKTYKVPQTDLDTQILQRRREELERIGSLSNREDLFPGCTDFEPKALNATELTNSCAREVLSSNWGTLRAEDCAPAPWLLLVLFPAVLLPATWARSRAEKVTSTMASGLLLSGPAAAVYLGATWTNYSEKYMLAFVPVMAILAPVAGARVGRWIGAWMGHACRGMTVGLIASAVWVATVWPQPQIIRADAPRTGRTWETISAEAAVWAKEAVGPGDLLIDCVPLRVDLALLPESIPYRFGVTTEQPCDSWIQSPPEASGSVWLLNRAFDGATKTQPHQVAKHGWEILKHFGDGHYLWRRRAKNQKP